MSDAISFEVTGDKQAKALVLGMAHAAGDWSDFFRVEALVMRGQFRQQFTTQGGAGGEQWKPLSAVYAEWKSKHYPGQPILVATGQLRASFTQSGAAHSVERIDAKSLTIGSSDPVAKFHQFGTRKMPARKIIAISAEYRKALAARMRGYILAKAKGGA